MTSFTKKHAAGLTTLVIVVILLTWLFKPWNPVPFNSDQWKSNFGTERPTDRQRMVSNLLNKHLHTGMDRTSLEKLLGEPSSENYFNTYDLVYWLGPEGGIMGIDSEWLVIKLDEDDNFLHTTILTD